ncbi:MAG: T9SS type A sorting domain-containing protein [Bacteroidota bacterium]
MRGFVLLLVSTLLVVSFAQADKPMKTVAATNPENSTGGLEQQFAPSTLPIGATARVGTYTSLTGFYDYQSNGGGVQHIRVDPASGWIHVVFMVGDDSSDYNNARRTAYAFSTDGGVSWNNLGDIRVPSDRRSGFPTLDLAKGPFAGGVLIANHAVVGTPVKTIVSVDYPPGSGVFAELGTQGNFATGEPIWPYVAGAADGSVITHSSINTTAGTDVNYLQRTTDFLSWSSWQQFPLVGATGNGGRSTTLGSAGGKVGTIYNAVASGVFFLESTDNGATWPSTATQIHPPTRIEGPDTFQNFVGVDFVYNGETPLFVFEELNVGVNEPTDGAQATFWSQATGYVVAATKTNTPGAADLNLGWVNYPTLGTSSIGMSGSTIVIAYNRVQTDTAAGGFNFSDVWLVHSTDGGATWSTPSNLTNTPDLDERYPSVSKWNAPGEVNIVWQEDTQPGPFAFNGGFTLAPVSRASQVFMKVQLSTDVDEEEGIAKNFALRQNYPNPFNPSTKIAFRIPNSTDVRLSVHNTLGQEVATLVDGYRSAGAYEVDFSGKDLPSGVYFYSLRAGKFSDFKKMILVK